MTNSLRLHGLQHARPPCPSPTPRVCSNSCPLSQWCHPTISSSIVPFSFCLQSFPGSGFFSNESVLCIRWWKYWPLNILSYTKEELSGSKHYSVEVEKTCSKTNKQTNKQTKKKPVLLYRLGCLGGFSPSWSYDVYRLWAMWWAFFLLFPVTLCDC